MERRVCVFLADGFEEIEGLTVVDLLRRAGVKVTTASIMVSRKVLGSHGIEVQADALFEEVDFKGQDMVVLPGGMPGTTRLGEHGGVKEVLEYFYEQKKYIGAICAAPSVLGKYGMLRGRRATSYPGFEEALCCASYETREVVVDEFLITSRGLGTAIPFALSLIGTLLGEEKAEEIRKSVIYQCS